MSVQDLRDDLRSLSTEEALVQLALGSLSEIARWELLWLTDDRRVLRVLAKDDSQRVRCNADFRLHMRGPA